MAFWQTILVNLAAKTVPAHDALFGICPKDIDNWLKEIANIRPKEPGLFFFLPKAFFSDKNSVSAKTRSTRNASFGIGVSV